MMYIKQGDLLPYLRTTLKDASTGQVVDLSSATGARVRIVKNGEAAAHIDAVAAIVSPATGGKLEYAWQSGDTDEAGDYLVEWTVSYGAGYSKTYPSSSYNILSIVPRLPGA